MLRGKRMKGKFDITLAMKIPLMIGLMIVIFILWAMVMQVDGGAKASGTITSISNRQIISHFEGGVIKEVLVSEGDIVTKGQALIVVENLSLNEKRNKNLAIISAMEPKINRLKSELKQKEFKIIQDNKYTQQELDLFVRRKNKLNSEVNVLQDEIEQNTSERKFLDKSSQLLIEEINVLKEELTTARRLNKLGASSRDEVNVVEKSLIGAKNRLNEVSLNIARTEKSIKKLKSRINLKRNSFLNQTQEELDKAIQQLTKAKTTYNIVKVRQTRSVLRAIENGIIYKLWTPVEGMITQAGRAIIEISTQNSNTEVVSKVSIADRDKIWVDMDAKILISHWKLPSRPINAKVDNISADSFINDKTGDAYYKVTIVAEDIDNKTYKQLLAGMVVEVLFVSGKHSIADYLINPMTKGVSQIMSEPIFVNH